MDRKVLEKYLALEKETRQYEVKDVRKIYMVKEKQLLDLNETVKQLDQYHKQCVAQTEKEKQDVDNMAHPSVKTFFQQQSDYDAKLSKEQEEYLEALNKQEIAKKELDGVQRQRDTVGAEVKALKKETDKLQKLYQEQDELLAGVFNGKYGSDQEYRMECDLDLMLDRMQRISVAKYKWQNARLLLQHAVNQLAFAVRRWGEVAKVKPEHMQVRYTMATECRNNLVAASQNVTSAQKYLHTIEFPYVKPDELMTLNRATNNIYTDMQVAERHAHALQCYGTTHKRSAALLQWFDHVIKNTIEKDQERAKTDVDAKSKALRAERLRLIKEKIRETKGEGENLDLDNEFELADGPEMELQNLAMDADKVSNAGDLQSGSAEDRETGEVTQGTSGAPTPLPLSELAPAPKNDELFGDIDQLKKQHEQELEEFSKAQEVNKVRMEQGLQEKLRARRSRRARLEQQDEQEQS